MMRLTFLFISFIFFNVHFTSASISIQCSCKPSAADPRVFEISMMTGPAYYSECVGIYSSANPTTLDCLSEGAKERRLYCPPSENTRKTFNATSSGTYYCIGWDVLCYTSFSTQSVECKPEMIDPEIPKSSARSKQSSITVITLSIIGGMVIFLAFVAFVLFYRRRWLKHSVESEMTDYAPVSVTDLTEDYSSATAVQTNGMPVQVLAPVYIATQPH